MSSRGRPEQRSRAARTWKQRIGAVGGGGELLVAEAGRWRCSRGRVRVEEGASGGGHRRRWLGAARWRAEMVAGSRWQDDRRLCPGGRWPAARDGGEVEHGPCGGGPAARLEVEVASWGDRAREEALGSALCA